MDDFCNIHFTELRGHFKNQSEVHLMQVALSRRDTIIIYDLFVCEMGAKNIAVDEVRGNIFLCDDLSCFDSLSA